MFSSKTFLSIESQKELAVGILALDLDCSKSSLHRYLAAQQFTAVKGKPRVMLTNVHKQAGLDFAHYWLGKTTEERRSIIFSD